MGILAMIFFSDIAIALVSLVLTSFLLQKLTNKKGPIMFPVLGITPYLVLNFKNLFDWVTLSLIKAGGTFSYRGISCMGSFGIVTVDPSKIEYMLKTKFKNFPKGKYYRERFHELLGEGIFNADDELWRQQRRAAVSQIHSTRFLEYSVQNMQELVHQKLLKLLDKVATSRGTIDLQGVFLRFTFDNICRVAFGIDTGCLSLDLPDVPFAQAFEEATELTLLRFVRPPIVWKPLKFLGIGSERKLKEAVQIVHDFAEKIVQERKMNYSATSGGGLTDMNDLLSRIILDGNSDESGDKRSYSDKLLRDFCISFILAGRDTSSVALVWFFWLINKNKDVESKIIAELSDIIRHRKLKNSAIKETIFTSEELKKMVYLQAAMSETLRLYPPVPADFKEALEDDVFPDGTKIKRGARVIYSIYSMGRMESIWGKDCLEFKPERWIKNGVHISENQFQYPVFNAGPRYCVGKKFAMLQMTMVAASILLRYSVKVVEGHIVCPKLNTTLYMKHGLIVTLEKRLK